MNINSSNIKNYFNKNKKTIGIIMFCILYIIFWLWYFGERNISIKEPSVVSIRKNNNLHNNNENSDIVKVKKEFTDEDLKNFWLEIDNDNVKIKAPIVNGVTDEKLEQGVGHHRTTAMPGEEGNVVLSGHRWKFGNNPAYTVFEDLDKLKEGDKITVHYNNQEFVYKIKESKTVGSKAVEILEKTKEATLTLYTCTPKYTALKRLVYTAELIK